MALMHVCPPVPRRTVAAAVALSLTFGTGWLLPLSGQASDYVPTTREWLQDAPDDDSRWRLIEQVLGGYAVSMWEVGQRYQHIHQALSDGNLELAAYHWEELEEAIVAGNIKRPARRGNAEALFLRPLYDSVLEDFQSDDADQAWRGFMAVREACMSCHITEDVAFMNEQPMFTDLRRPD